MKKLPIGKQNFEGIIKEGYLYVDKTLQIFQLIKEGSLYFLSRPRRFGKSLLLSTLKQIFSGNKEIFKGLYILEKTDYDWPIHPILQFNFAKLGHRVTNLETLLKGEIKALAKQYSIHLEKETLSLMLTELASKLAEQQSPIVLLVDEYDKPIIDFITELEQANKNRRVLRSFFSPLKDLESKGYIKFLFITGVSKFSRVSIFSDLNNLTDLTLDPLANDLVGITQEEVLKNFAPYIKRSTEQLDMPEADLLKGIKLWYDGYSYDGKTFLYNPFSLLNFFRKSRFGNFWFETGTPTFLVETIRNTNVNPNTVEGLEVTEIFFNKFSIEHLDIHGLLFQTGYLTIKKATRQQYELFYELAYPNEEVRKSFIHNLLEAFSYQTSGTVGNALVKMQRALVTGQLKPFIAQLKILLSDISYHLLPKSKKDATQKDKDKAFGAWEGYFQTIVYLVTSFLGLNVQTEITKHKGRLDLIAETDEFLYLMEFKLDEPAQDAIQQIKDREYLASYKNAPKTTILVGIGFSQEERNVETWEEEIWIR